jgi:hypothetical protein
LEFGIPGLALLLFGFGVFYYRMGKEFFIKKNPRFFFWMAILTANLIYSYIEPNMIFQRELTALFYIFIYLFPLELDIKFTKEFVPVKKPQLIKVNPSLVN